ncbi:MAG: MFS transporter [Acidobacteriota bacterium]
MKSSKNAVWYALVVLFAINTLNFFDRQILGAVGEPIRKEFGLDDASLGLLNAAFTILYAFVGIPLGLLADKFGRKRILAVGVFVWSLLTAGTGFVQNFGQMFALRLGVGVGEASCAPAANSLIGDLFPASRRAKALAIFMLGVPVGLALSFAISGSVAKQFGWRAAFFVAGIPGVLCAIAVLFVAEPKRGASEIYDIGNTKREGSTILNILRTPTMLWIILSGAIFNFNAYALAAFITPYLMRFHQLDIQEANFISTIVYGVMGGTGLLIGGAIGDAVVKRRNNGRMFVGSIAMMLSIPLVYFALQIPRGGTTVFLILMGTTQALWYFYYSTVYATIQDVTEPAARGTAMAVYFFALYIFGASFGSYVTGLLSDFFTKRAAQVAGVTDISQAALEPFRAEGLHSAMYVIPILGVVLTFVLLAASRTVAKDVERLQDWMQKSATSNV